MGRNLSWSRVASNWFFGVAVGLLGYYALTSVVAGLSQRELRAEAPMLRAYPVSRPAADVLDFSKTAADHAYWRALPEGGAFGRIVCGRIELDAIVVKGVAPQDLKRGPGWAPYTDLPGPSGNCGISGHRTTYGAPFRRIDALRPGDLIDLVAPETLYRYRVERVFVVRPDQVEVFETTDEPCLTMTACHPPYSARYRIVVRARMLAAIVRDTTGE